MKTKQNSLNEGVKKENKKQMDKSVQYKDLEKLIDTHMERQFRKDDEIDIAEALNISKKKKNIAPLTDGFVNYFAFKTEESKLYKVTPKEDGGGEGGGGGDEWYFTLI